MEAIAKRDYVKPVGRYIYRDDGTELLYQLEEAATKALRNAAQELGRVLGHDPDDFYLVTLPEALLQVLNSWEPMAARLAAQAFLERGNP